MSKKYFIGEEVRRVKSAPIIESPKTLLEIEVLTEDGDSVSGVYIHQQWDNEEPVEIYIEEDSIDSLISALQEAKKEMR